jgi:hypothetical protein
VLVVLFIGITALVIDLGMLRMDRRANRAAADAAAVAGSAALGRGGNSPAKACEQAMRYAEASLGTATGADNCAATFGGPVTCSDASTTATATESVEGRTIAVSWPIHDGDPLLTDPDRERSPGSLVSQPTSGRDGDLCQRIAVQITQNRQLAFAVIWGWSDVTTQSHSVGLAEEGGRGGSISPLIALEPTACNALRVDNATLTVHPAVGDLNPGEISVDSDGTGTGCAPGTAVSLANGGTIDALGTSGGAPGHIYTLEDSPSYPGCTPLCPTPEQRSDPVTEAPWRDRYNCDDLAPAGCANTGVNNATLPAPHDYVDQFATYDPPRPPPGLPLPVCLVDAPVTQPATRAVCPPTDPLTISDTGVLHVDGDLEVVGELNVSGGQLEVTGDLYVDPDDHVEVTSGGSIDVGGILTIRDRPLGFDLAIASGRIAANGLSIDDDVRASGGCLVISRRLSTCVGWSPALDPDGINDTDGVKIGGDLIVSGNGRAVFDQTFVYVDDDLEVSAASGQLVLVAPYDDQVTECVPSGFGGLPTPGCFEDLALWVAGITNGDHTLTGNAATYLDGTTFDPTRELMILGDLPDLTAQLVADRILIQDGTLNLVGDAARSTLIPRSGGSLIR